MNRLFLAIFSLVITIVANMPAMAASVCYSPVEIRAEQLLRLHSELMVITVTCRQGSGGQDLSAAYSEFTHKNIHTLHEAEQNMIGFYRANKKGNPIDHLDRLRTMLGNEFGQKVADMHAPEFCGAYRDKVWQYAGATPADVENEIERMNIADHTYIQPCVNAKSIAAKKGS